MRARGGEWLGVLYALVIVAALDYPLVVTLTTGLVIDMAIDAWASNPTVVRYCLICGLICLIVAGWLRARYDRW